MKVASLRPEEKIQWGDYEGIHVQEHCMLEWAYRNGINGKKLHLRLLTNAIHFLMWLFIKKSKVLTFIN